MHNIYVTIQLRMDNTGRKMDLSRVNANSANNADCTDYATLKNSRLSSVTKYKIIYTTFEVDILCGYSLWIFEFTG